MKAVIQRVTSAQVCVDGRLIARTGGGYMILLGVTQEDGEEEMRLLARKVSSLRVFTDENGKMNRSVLDVSGEILVVSQFTLCADISHGNRPSFTPAAEPVRANELYLGFCRELEQLGVENVSHGEFGADMAVSITNDGPVTIVMDTDIWKKKGVSQ